MTQPFPEHFTPGAWKGARAALFPEPEDAFQQLVGDALREVLGGGVAVMPTAGRDGSIDAFIEHDAEVPPLFARLPGPIIVECKHNDDSLGRVRENIASAWKKVTKKLDEQAKLKWPTPYDPWARTESYVYLTSAVLPNQSARDELTKEISTYFRGLRAKGLSRVQEVCVLDWSNLRPLLDRLPRLADRWLGLNLPALLAHDEHLAALATGFRRYLLPEVLPFVAPPADHEAHPERLFDTVLLRAQSERGVLLTGAGGAGKTRTLIEVSRIADAAGWRVLHALHGEPALTDEDLARAVLAGGGKTLILCDYLDQMRLDIGSLRRRVIPEATKRRIRIAVLASARTARTALGTPDSSAFFEPVDLSPGEEQVNDLLTEMRARVAPRAAAILGAARVAELAGPRPIIALFILREVERRAEAGQLRDGDLGGVRPGELLDWLRRRLHEDQLVVRAAASPFDPDEVEPNMIAAAAVLGAAPQDEEHLRAVAADALRASSEVALVAAKAERGARAIVSGLRELGWLDARGIELAAAHDVVADEVLAQVLRMSARGEVRAEVLAGVLEAGKRSARTLGRFAVALRRILGGLDGSAGRFEAALAVGAERWFVGAVSAVGAMVAAADPDEASYALGAVIEGPPWAAAAERQWDAVVAPWLGQHGELLAARHLLYRGLRLGGELGKRLTGPGIRWLEKNGERFEATFVLGPLLSRKDLDPSGRLAGLQYALSWLKAHGTALDARFVLDSLLGRADLDPISSKAAAAYALAWLKAHGTALEAEFVFDSLLGRIDLDPISSKAVAAHALSWLAAHGIALEARFVLHPLLGRVDLDPIRSKAVAAYALSWLEAHGTALEAQFVLHPLLGRVDLDPIRSKAVVAYALSWLEAHGSAMGAGFVLPPLLGRTDLDPTNSHTAARHAMVWLALHGALKDSSFVLRMLLGRTDLPASVESEIVSLALSWTAANSGDSNIDFVLNRVLRAMRTPRDMAEQAAQQALAWLARSPPRRDRDYLLNSLLRRAELLDDDALRSVVDDACRWLRAFQPSGRSSLEMFLAQLRRAAMRVGRVAEVEAVAPSSTSVSGNAVATHAFAPQRQSFRDVTAAIEARAKNTSAIHDPAFLRSALAATREQLDRGSAVVTGFALPGLLPLAARSGDPTLLLEVRALAAEVLSDGVLLPHQRLGLAGACYRLLDADAWPDRIEGLRILTDLGLQRPPGLPRPRG